jgi:hypothetical protein
VRSEGVDPDLLADQVAGRFDGAAVERPVPDVGVLVAAVVADHGLDRCLGRDELHDRAVERAAEVGLAGGRGLDVLRTADGVADPLELDRAQIAEVLGEFGGGDRADRALVLQLGDLRAVGGLGLGGA